MPKITADALVAAVVACCTSAAVVSGKPKSVVFAEFADVVDAVELCVYKEHDYALFKRAWADAVDAKLRALSARK